MTGILRQLIGETMNRLMIPLMCLIFMFIGAMGAKSWENESIRTELRAEKEAELKELQDTYVLALKPITAMCKDAAFRSIRAAKTASAAADKVIKILEYKNARTEK